MYQERGYPSLAFAIHSHQGEHRLFFRSKEQKKEAEAPLLNQYSLPVGCELGKLYIIRKSEITFR